MSKNKKNRSDSKFGVFALGTSIGVVAGMLLAQKTGSELRDEISEVAEQLKEKAVDIIENKDEYIETIKEAVDNAVKKDEIIKYSTPDYYEKTFDIKNSKDI